MKRRLIVVALVCVLSGTVLAGDMPGGGRSITGEMPGVGGSAPGETSTPPVVGEMPGGGPSTSSETESSLVTTVLLTFITLMAR